MSYINLLEGYKSYIKACHWGADNMSEHKLMDDVAESVSSCQDEVAEIAQGLFGKLSVSDLNPTGMHFTNSKILLSELIKDTNKFYGTIDGEQFIGMRSVIEAFLGELNKFQYLLTLCLKEAIAKRLKGNQVEMNENYNLSEGELRKLIRESVKTVLKRIK